MTGPSAGPVGDLPDEADQLAIMGDWLVGKVDGCTCAPFEGQHEPHCGWEPCAPLAVIVAMVEPLIRAHIADELRAYALPEYLTKGTVGFQMQREIVLDCANHVARGGSDD